MKKKHMEKDKIKYLQDKEKELKEIDFEQKRILNDLQRKNLRFK